MLPVDSSTQIHGGSGGGSLGGPHSGHRGDEVTIGSTLRRSARSVSAEPKKDLR